MKTEKNKGIGWQQISLIIVPMIVAIFLSYNGMNQRLDASSRETNQRIDASSQELNEKIDRILARVDTINREMGEIKTEMSGMNQEISEMKTEMKLCFDSLEKRE